MKAGKVRVLISSALAVVALAATAQTAGASSLYWSEYPGDNVGRLTLDTYAIDWALLSNPIPPPAGHLATDSKHLYWVSFDAGLIGRSNLDGSEPDFDFIDVPDPSRYAAGIAVDSNYIYWSDYESRIGRARLDGGGVDGDFITGLARPYGLAVDSRHIYWGSSIEDPNGAIGRADLDGENVDASFIEHNAAGVAVNSSHIYWTCWRSDLPGCNSIGRARLDRTEVDPQFLSGPPVNGPEGIALSSSDLYWANFGNRDGDSIARASLSGGGPEEIVVSDLLNGVAGVAVRESRASISTVRVTGPARAKKGKPVAYRVAITNAGDLSATGVRARISGRGVAVNAPVGAIPAGVTRTITVRTRFRQVGRVQARVAVTSTNAGGMTVIKTVRVVR